MSQRTERIDELLRQEIGRALEREVSDPRIGFVTVTKVETSPDLSRARVWVSVIGSADERKDALRALRGAMPYIRRGLGPKLRLRRIPELDVKVDDTLERGTRVLHLLDELEAGRTPEDVAAGAESLPTPVKRLPHEGDAVEAAGAAPDAASGVPKASRKPRRRREPAAGERHRRGRQ
jgi:ribosome-binding factor A